MTLFVVKCWDTHLLPFQRNFLSLNLISVYLQFDYINSFLGDHILDKLYFVVSYQWYTYNHINMYTYIWMNRFIDHQTRKHPIFLFIDCLIIYLIIKTLCSWPICCLHFTSWIRKSWTMIFELNKCQHFTPLSVIFSGIPVSGMLTILVKVTERGQVLTFIKFGYYYSTFFSSDDKVQNYIAVESKCFSLFI